MPDFASLAGFEDRWRFATRLRMPQAILHGGGNRGYAELALRLKRLSNNAPEVVIRITGRARTPHSLRANLNYISRGGELTLIDRDGVELSGRKDLEERASDWVEIERLDRFSRSDRPLGYMIVLSAPEGSDPQKVLTASHAFMHEAWADERDFVSVLHTDTRNPHMHVLLCGRGRAGEAALNRQQSLMLWREQYAEKLRDQGIEVEATSRIARGLSHRSEKSLIYRMRLEAERDSRPLPRVVEESYREALLIALSGQMKRPAWEERLVTRQSEIKRLYLRQALLLRGSPDTTEKALGERLVRFVAEMPPAQSRQTILVDKMLRALQARERRSEKDVPRARAR